MQTGLFDKGERLELLENFDDSKRRKLLSRAARQANYKRSKVRSRVAHVLSVQQPMAGMAAYIISIARVGVKIGLMNLMYNLKHFVHLQWLQAADHEKSYKRVAKRMITHNRRCAVFAHHRELLTHS